VSSAPLRVAIFGGAFDPFHNGHLATVSLLFKSNVVDYVIVVPCGDRPDKAGTSRGTDRLAMTTAGLRSHYESDQRVSVSDAQVIGEAGFATIDLIRYFKKARPRDELFVVIGEELVGDLSQWHESDALKSEAEFLVVHRPGATEPVLPHGWRIRTLTSPYEGEVDISSTELRRRLRAGESCEGLMPKSVIEYCVTHNLYR
jgi:nicotinate-nucleotide adenylyltransferase